MHTTLTAKHSFRIKKCILNFLANQTGVKIGKLENRMRTQWMGREMGWGGGEAGTKEFLIDHVLPKTKNCMFCLTHYCLADS